VFYGLRFKSYALPHSTSRRLQKLYFKNFAWFKTACKDDSGYITQLKQQKNKKGDIT